MFKQINRFQIQNVSNSVLEASIKQSFETWYSQLKQHTTEIDGDVLKFVRILKNFESNCLVKEVQKFVDDLRAKDLDFKVIGTVVKLDTRTVDKTNFLLNSYLEYIKVVDIEVSTTIQQQIEWFYGYILMYTLKYNFLELRCYQVLDSLSNSEWRV